jgi:hypothetical protein
MHVNKTSGSQVVDSSSVGRVSNWGCCDRNRLELPQEQRTDSTFVIWLVIGFKISQGRNWARITFLVLSLIGLVLFLISLPFYVFYVRAEFGRSPILPVLSVLQGAFQVTGILLAFTPPANDWFRKTAEVAKS